MLLQSLMQNPFAWLLLSFCTIAAFLFAIITWILGKNKKYICFKKHSHILIDKGKTTLPELSICYREKNVADLSITKCAIWNCGNDVVNGSDMVTSKPLTIYSVDKDTELLSASIVEESDDTNNFSIRKTDEKHFIIDFDYINSKEGVVLQIVHTGSSAGIECNCKIKGGKGLKTDKQNWRLHIANKKKAILWMTIIYSLFVIISILWIDFRSMGLIPNINENSIGFQIYKYEKSVMPIIMNLMCVYLIFLEWQMIKSVYSLYIPVKLRKAYCFDD